MTTDSDSPYESPIEEDLAWSLTKYVDPGTAVETQVECETRCGKFRVDFVLARPGAPRVGLECDGAAFHDEIRDEWRDAILLGDGQLDAMLRLRGSDIYYRQPDLLYLVSRLYPAFFSDRGLGNLQRLSSPEVRATRLEYNHRVTVRYLDEPWIGNEPTYLQLTHRTARHGLKQHPFWRTLYAFATSRPPQPLALVIAAFQARGLRSRT